MRHTIIILSLMALVFGLSSCGKRGDLLPPPGYEKS